MKTWMNSNWLDIFIITCIVILEVTTITPWLIVIQRLSGNSGLSPFVPIGAAVLGSITCIVVRLLLAKQWDIAAVRGVSIGIWAGLLVIWYAFVADAGLLAPLHFLSNLVQFDSGVIGLLLLSGLVWWRGLMLANSDDLFSPAFLRAAVIRGVASVSVAVVLIFLVEESFAQELTNAITVIVPILVISGLLAATGAQVRFAQRRAETASGQSVSGIGWLGAASGISVGVLLIASVIAAIAGYQFWNVVLWPFRMFFDLVGFLVYWALTGVAYVAFLLLSPLFWLISLVSDSETETQEQESDAPGPLDSIEQTQGALPEPLILIVQIIIIALIIGIVVYIAMRQFRKFQGSASDEDAEESRENLFSTDALRDDLAGFLNSLRPDWQRRRRTAFDINARPESVRDAYRHVLAAAHRRNLARFPNETPDEYGGRLSERSTQAEPAVQALTRGYLASRYGEIDDSPEAINQARNEWDTIRNRLTE